MGYPAESGNKQKMYYKTANKKQTGQTLMETIIAIFILTTALTTALGLAVYAFSRSQVSQDQIIASYLAAEGIDVVRMMRDSNWLRSDVSSDSSYHLQTCAALSGSFCYPKVWIEPPPDGYSLNEPGNWRLVLDPTDKTYNFDPHADGAVNAVFDYNLYLQPDGTYSHEPDTGTSTFARLVNLSILADITYPIINGYGSKLVVKSVVAWRGKGCTPFNTNQDLLTLNTPCKVVVEEHLTNWKDYQ
jgi:hypothetical protein